MGLPLSVIFLPISQTSLFLGRVLVAVKLLSRSLLSLLVGSCGQSNAPFLADISILVYFSMQLHWFYFCQELTVFGLYHISKIVECYWACFKTFFMNGIHIMRYIWGFNPLRFCLYKLFQICCSKWTYFTETRGTFSLRLSMRPQWWDYPFDNDHVT